jgi:hypothetical protein
LDLFLPRPMRTGEDIRYEGRVHGEKENKR